MDRAFGILTAVALYFLVSVAFFFPVLLNPDNVFLGTFGDIGPALHIPSYLHYNQVNGIQSMHTELLNAPFGSNISQMGYFLFFNIYLVFPISLATSPLFAYNLFMFFAPFLSAVAMFFLARHFIKSSRACFVSGLVFGFSPYIIARTIANHNHLAHGAWLVLFILALFRFNESKTYKNALFLGVSLAVVGFFSYYYLFFAAIFAAIFYLYRFWAGRKTLLAQVKTDLGNLPVFAEQHRHYFAAAAFFLIVFSFTVLPMLLAMVSGSDASVFRSALGGRTNLMNAVYLSAWPHHFFTPFVYQPIFRQAVSEFLINTLVGTNFTVATVFLGFTALALSSLALAKMKNDRIVKFFLFCAVAVFVLAVGPFVRYVPFFGLSLTVVPALLAFYCWFLGHKKLAKAFAAIFVLLLFFPLLYPLLPVVQDAAVVITGIEQLQTASLGEVVEHLEKYSFLPIPMPSFFIFRALPVFRAFARLGLLLMVCVAVLAGFGMQLLLQRFNSKAKRNALTFLVAAFVLFEVLSFPPYMVTDVSQTPAEYQWLAEQPGSPIVLEYPLNWDDFYVFYQLRHMKPIMNGKHSGKFDALKKDILDPTSQETLSVLAGFNVKYIITHDDWFLSILHEEMPEAESMAAWLSNDESRLFARVLDEGHDGIPGVKLVKEFPHAKVFEVTAEPKQYVFD